MKFRLASWWDIIVSTLSINISMANKIIVLERKNDVVANWYEWHKKEI